MTIDVHTHVTPDEIPARAGYGRLWPTLARQDPTNATIMIDAKPFRRIDSRCWDATRRLHDMTEQDIEVQILSPMPELLSFWLPPAETRTLAAIVNEHIAAMIAVAPARFGGLGMVTAQHIPTALAELDEIERLGLRGIEIGTHINGMALGDAALWPLWEAAEARGLAIFVHPLHPCGMERIGGPQDVATLATFPLEIAMAAISLMAGGVLGRFPGLRILLSHGGGALPGLLGRLEQGRTFSPAIRAALAEPPDVAARRFWFDSNVYDPATLRFLAAQIGPDRLVVGSDYPFVIAQDRPGRFVEAALPGTAHQCTWNAAAFLATP